MDNKAEIRFASLLRKALQIATEAHKDQKRFDGSPYIVHPRRVLMAYLESTEKLHPTPTEEQIEDATVRGCAALLHDVIEDTTVTADQLVKEGMPQRVVDAVIALTKVKDEGYEDYLKRVAANPDAKEVKKFDMLDNLNDKPTKNGIKKYKQGLDFLHPGWETETK